MFIKLMCRNKQVARQKHDDIFSGTLMVLVVLAERDKLELGAA